MKLKPCPFCGGEKIETVEIEVAGTDSTYIVCVNCGSCTKLHNSKEQAIEAWNRREPIDKIVEQLEHYAKESHIIYIREDEECCRGWFEALEFAIEIVKSGGAV